ncbi:MAG: carbohydrate ABC transporter permease, partial [Propionicimonas sp.]|nr:carbohydrate ABC transporter permease [Propionicimonas sp.]
VALFNVLGTWNDVIWPLVTLNDKGLFPLALGLLRFRDSYYTAWGPLMAGYAIAAIPLLLLFIFANRTFVEGAVAMKGRV